jgi:hypothetical protein
MKAWEPTTDRAVSTAASCLCRYFIMNCVRKTRW